MLIQRFLSKARIKGLNRRILCWLPGMSHTPANRLYSYNGESVTLPEPHGFSHEIPLYGETKEKKMGLLAKC